MSAPLLLPAQSPALSFVLVASFVIATAVRTLNDTTTAIKMRMFVRKTALHSVSPFLRSDALVSLGACMSGMVFQTMLGNPVDLGTMAPFAMGIPLLCAWAGFQRWSTPSRANA